MTTAPKKSDSPKVVTYSDLLADEDFFVDDDMAASQPESGACARRRRLMAHRNKRSTHWKRHENGDDKQTRTSDSGHGAAASLRQLVNTGPQKGEAHASWNRSGPRLSSIVTGRNQSCRNRNGGAINLGSWEGATVGGARRHLQMFSGGVRKQNGNVL